MLIQARIQMLRRSFWKSDDVKYQDRNTFFKIYSYGDYRRNHYVPQWYQKLFLPSSGEKKFFYLDLKPEIVTTSTGKNFKRKSLLRWGTPSCFYQDDLYTTSFANGLQRKLSKNFLAGLITKVKRH